MKKPKKILFTVHDFYPKVGGAGEVVHRLAKRFAQAGYDVTVATEYLTCSADCSADCPRNNLGFKVCEFKISGNQVKGYQATNKEIERYIDFVTDRDWDAVINYAAQSWCSDLVFENIDKIRAKKILVPCGYSALALRDPRYFFYFRWLPKILEKYDYLVYLSQVTPDFLFHQKHQIKTPWVLIPNGADKEEFLGSCYEALNQENQSKIREKFSIQTPFLAICVANYFFLKGQDFVIRAFNQLKRNDVSLILIGKHKNSIYFRALKFLAQGNPRILFLENLSRTEVVDFFKAADFFLFGSRVECSPLIMFESFAAKTLFITRHVGNVGEYADYNVIVTSPSQMKNALEKVISDKNFYRQKVNLAFEKYLKNHTYEVLFKKYQELVES